MQSTLLGGKPKIKDVFVKLLPLAAEWRNIGVMLDISDDKLQAIERDRQQGNDCLREMISEWLKSIDPPPTWSKLADAVKPFHPAMAKEIRDSVATSFTEKMLCTTSQH